MSFFGKIIILPPQIIVEVDTVVESIVETTFLKKRKRR
jgi:hypothetical protein